MAELPNVLCGVAGEYFVAGELSRRGYIASITLRNTKGIDILVSNSDATAQIGVQVKSSQSDSRAWLLSAKGENYFAGNLFYVFVNLKENNQRPDYYIVPSEIVAKYISKSHKEWLGAVGRNGRKHQDTPIRQFRDDKGEYLERWNILGI
jgi:hypothetical protein